MAKVSIIIPGRNEIFLPTMIDNIYAKATGDIEVIPVLDGYWPNPPLEERSNLVTVHLGRQRGLRAAVNAGAAVAKGKYLLKADAHCCFGEGFDEILQQDCEDNWIVIMRRYSLDPDKWDRNLEKTPIDYHYLSCPWNNKEFLQIHGVTWSQRAVDRKDLLIDDEMSFQGSGWFMTANHFNNRLHGMDETPRHYGTFSQEPQEIGMKTWLGGGRIVVNKKTWYAHLHKGKRFGRMYHLSMEEVRIGHIYSAHYWTEDKWEGRIHNFDWFIEHFWPIPNWIENWRDYYEGRLKYEGIQ